MNNINSNRFWNYAKWDLAINKSFYRNMAVGTMSLVLMVAIMGYFIRLLQWRSMLARMDEYMQVNGVEPEDLSHESWFEELVSVDGALVTIVVVCSLAMIVFAGCVNHPLRNKQSRITTLTLPVTNKEKYLWHVGLMLGGGLLLCIVSVLLADLFNALLSVVTFGPEGAKSLVARFFTVSGELLGAMRPGGDEHVGLLYLMSASLPVSYLLMVTVFAFGNALKYKFNILLTVVALQVLQFAFSIVFFLVVAICGVEWMEQVGLIDEEDVISFMYAFFGVLLVVQLALMVWMWRKSYKLYCKAQITSRWNK